MVVMVVYIDTKQRLQGSLLTLLKLCVYVCYRRNGGSDQSGHNPYHRWTSTSVSFCHQSMLYPTGPGEDINPDHWFWGNLHDNLCVKEVRIEEESGKWLYTYFDQRNASQGTKRSCSDVGMYKCRTFDDQFDEYDEYDEY